MLLRGTSDQNSANLELLIDKTSSIYLYVKLKARRGAQFVPIRMPTNQDLSLRYAPSKLLIFQLNIPPYRMTN
jgi:hypothetical protein